MDFYKENFRNFFHYFAWTISLTASVFFIIFEIREDIILVFHDHDKLMVIFLASLLLSIFGSFYSIYKTIKGGTLMIIGGTGMVVYYCILGGLRDFPMMIAFGLPYIIPGVFFLFIRKS
jgi:hypothetical protein